MGTTPQPARADQFLMLTYPGYDTPDGRSLTPQNSILDHVLQLLKSGHRLEIPRELLNPTPEIELPLQDHTPTEHWQLVVYDEEEAQRQTALHEARRSGDLAATMKALLETSENYRRQQREEAIRQLQMLLKRLEQERLEREERERREAEARARQEFIQQKQQQREMEAKATLASFRQRWLSFRYTFLMASQLPDFPAELRALEQAQKWGPLQRRIAQMEEFVKAAEALAADYASLIRGLNFKPYLQTKFNVALTALAAAIAQDPVGTQKARRLEHLKTEIANETQQYDRIKRAWDSALEATLQRVKFIPKEKRAYKEKKEAVKALAMTVLTDPFAPACNQTLQALNDEIDKEVEKPEKEKQKTAVYKALYESFIASESKNYKLPPKRYNSLASYEKALIRMIRNGEAADSAPIAATGRNILWERQSHNFSGTYAPNFKGGGAQKAEYRLWQDTFRQGATTKVANNTTWYLTGERMTSFGQPGTNRILFFYNQHPSGTNAYIYGLVTHLPMRHDKSKAKQRYFPDGYPPAPGPVS